MISANAIQQHRSTIKLFLRVLNVNLGIFFFGFCLGVLNMSQPTINQVLNIDSDQESLYDGLINCFLAIGAIFGSGFSSILLQFLSRRQVFMLSDIVGIVGSCLAMITTIETFLIHRLFVGFAVGINSSLVPLYVREFSPVQISGLLGSVNGVFIPIGVVVSYLLGLGFTTPPTQGDEYWRFVFLFPVITCFIRTALFIIVYKEESPIYYALNNKEHDAKQIIRQLYHDEFCDRQMQQIQYEKDSIKNSATTFQDLIKGKLQKRLIIGVLLQVLQQFSGYSAVTFYSNTIFYNATQNNTTSFWLSVAYSCLLIITALISGIFTKYMGRKQILLVGDSICAVVLASLAICSYVYQTHNDNAYLQVFIIIFIYGYTFGFGISLGPVIWLYNAEILPDKGVSLSTLANWACVIIITFLFPVCNDNFGIWPIFLVFALCAILGLVMILFWVKETKGLTSTEIEQAYDGIYKIKDNSYTVSIPEIIKSENENTEKLIY